MKDHLIGMDIGGSHVSAALMNENESGINRLIHKSLNSAAGASSIIETISDVINELAYTLEGHITIGIAMPGPFNYKEGVCEIRGVGGKFSACFGLHFIEALKTYTGLKEKVDFFFFNDAQCFAIGAYQHEVLRDTNVISLTLGTGFGSTFIMNGTLTNNHADIPESGMFYNEPFKDALADDYFSTRWLLNAFQNTTGRQIGSVKELAAIAPIDPAARNVFAEFGTNLAIFLAPWIKKSKTTALILGGNLTKSWSLFKDHFLTNLKTLGSETPVFICENTEQRIMEGAARLAKETASDQNKSVAFRNTSQPLLPIEKPQETSEGYEIFPSFHVKEGKIETGFSSLALAIAHEKTVVIDGYGGILWDRFRETLNTALLEEGIKPLWFNINTGLKKEDTINSMIAGNLNGDDPVFGKRYTGQLLDFFDEEKLSLISPDQDAGMCILYGTGAALCGWIGKLIFLDLPKNEIQYRMRAKCIYNLGASTTYENTQMYKRFYFVDWPVLNEHKKELLPEIDILVDEQRVSEISWITGDALRNSLGIMVKNAFRARPWFETGIWGGQWMKQNLKGLNPDVVNYAWSFELITPENGVVLEHNNNLLEVSFDFLLYHNHEAMLGNASKRFGYEFPIRFDFLDTFDGGNLSIQCHPTTVYIREHFGEHFTQDETYYILDAKSDAEVYLGFQEDIDPDEFRIKLNEAQDKGTEINIKKYVQHFRANKHDLFLIPNGTIHASGRNNMVLEISSTPYIFTFKMYDWQRLDLTGKPRPINIDHAFNNLSFDRKGDWVQKNLVSKPELIESGTDYKKYLLPTHPEHFYRIERYEFTRELVIRTNGQCHIGMLVEGSSILITTDQLAHKFHYAETFVVPAAAGEYILKNNGTGTSMVVVAYVKEELT